MTSFPMDLALADVVRRTADGGSATALLLAITERTLQAMGAGAHACAVVLGGPDSGYEVHACAPAARLDDTGDTVPEQVLLGGPVLVTATSGATTTVNDLTTGESRWTAWADVARTAGLRGARCWPVTVAGRPVGALVVLTTDPWAGPTAATGSARSSSAGQALADLCSVVLQLPPPSQRWGQVLVHLHAEVEQDVTVHQAVGMIAAAHETDVPAAAAALRAHAGRLAVAVATLARDVVERRVPARDVPRA